jgi:hypothetical protein
MTSWDDSEPTTGQGTETATNAQEAGKARRLANLRPPFRKGETGNPRGINGRGSNEIAMYLDKPELTGAERTRFEALVEAQYQKAMAGDSLAAKTLITYKLGSNPPSSLDLAEHCRRVARDKADLALKVLGARIDTMAGTDLAAFFRECSGYGQGFIEAAEAATEQPEGATVEAQPASVVEPMPAPPESTPVLPDSDEGWPKP